MIDTPIHFSEVYQPTGLRRMAPHRLILTLFCIEGLKHQDIATIFDVPEGTVWSRLHKAKQELRKELKAIED